jgi:hypothetical protein
MGQPILRARRIGNNVMEGNAMGQYDEGYDEGDVDDERPNKI